MDYQSYFMLGGYLLSSGAAGFLWREIIKLRNDVTSLRLELATQRGLDLGQDHERRLTRLERLFNGRE
jgi:hypothetical protein